MSYKCPFCKSTNTEEISKPVNPYTPYPYGGYVDDSIEYACRDCGQVSKIDTNYYKKESNDDTQDEQTDSEDK